jgi:lipoprotein-anchoring transpeptidase ErfK/SrfK
LTLPRIFLISAVAVFGLIGIVSVVKKQIRPPENIPIVEEAAVETLASDDLPEVDHIAQLFALDSSKLPIVETISYTSRVPWLKDRPAWIADYAAHYNTSRHFIARSLNHKPDYFTQKISPGDRFNVFKRDLPIEFYLLIDLSKCRMWFYYIDLSSNERVLLKTYTVGLGREDSKTVSGYLTPIGKYQLGDKIAVYKPGTMGQFQDRKIEMIRVFGTRWIPFEREVEGCTENAKGFGIHGAPWNVDPTTGQIAEDRNMVGKYESDGCIRLHSEDIEELFAIIVTKPTIVELVKDFHDAKLPGSEKGGS